MSPFMIFAVFDVLVTAFIYIYHLSYSFIFAVLLQFGWHWFSITSTKILFFLTKFRCFFAIFNNIKLQRYCGYDFDLSGQVTSSVMWSLDSQCVFPIIIIIVNKNQLHVSRTVVEILSFKDISVTSLTFWGHVMSSVTWPLDSQYGVSYRWSITTDRLFHTVFQIY